MSNLKIQRIVDEYPEHEFITIDGHDNAILGVSTDMRVIYCEDTIIKNLMNDMSEEEAIEFYDYNILGSYISELQPIMLKKI